MKKSSLGLVLAAVFMITPLGVNGAAAAVNLLSGNVTHRQELFAAGGGPLAARVALSYNSFDRRIGPLGQFWTHSYDIYLNINSDGMVVLTGGVAKRFYRPDGNGGFLSGTGDYSTLTSDGSTYSIAFPDGTTYRFGTDRRIAGIDDRYGNTVTFDYSVSNQLTVTDPALRQITIHSDEYGRIDWMKDPAQQQYDFTYHASGLLKAVSYPAPDPSAPSVRPVWSFDYTAAGYLEYVTDPAQNITTYEYSGGRCIKKIDPEGVGAENPDLYSTRYGHSYRFPEHSQQFFGCIYDPQNDRLDCPAPPAVVVLPEAEIVTKTEKDDGIWTFEYGAFNGLLSKKTDPELKVTSFTYHPDRELQTISSPVDTDTSYVTEYPSYDAHGKPTEIKGHVHHVSSNSDDPADRHLLLTYGSYDRLTSVSDQLTGAVTTVSYVTDPGTGAETVTITAPKINVGDTSGPQMVLLYRPDGQLDLVTDPIGRQIDYAYTASGLLRSATDAASGIVATFDDLDAMGRPQTVTVSATGQTSRVIHLVYDALGRVKTVTRDGNLDPQTQQLVTYVTAFGYDLLGNRTSVLDPVQSDLPVAQQKPTRFDYNYRGQATKITDALDQVTELLYSGAGCASCGGGVDKLVGVKDAKLQQTDFTYNQVGQLTSEIAPGDAATRRLLYRYDLAGRLSEKRLDVDGDFSADGVVDGADFLLLSFSYSPDGKLLSKTDNVTNETTTFTYYPLPTAPATDPKAGRLWTVSNPAASYTFTYFDNGWLKSVTDGNNRTVEYLYDAAGRRELVTIKQGAADLQSIDYVYDPTSKELTDIVSSLAGTFHFGTDAWGRRDSLAYPNGVHASYGYHADQDWLTSIAYPELGLSIAYPEHDKVGNRKQRSEDGVATDYDYDATYQLRQAKTGAAEENFTYDAVGNRESGPTVKDTAAVSYDHDAANRMTQGRKYTYEYDARGNQSFRYLDAAHTKFWQYSWDGENRLIEAKLVKAGATVRTVTFKYDPFGRRVEKRVEGLAPEVPVPLTTTYLYDGEDIVVQTVSDGSTTSTTQYVHGPGIDEPLARVANGQSTFYHADGLGSIVAISDSTKAIVQRYRYESFGQLTASDPAFANPYTYTGREWDPETGLYYYRARYYDAMEGRFISKDPIGFAGGDVNVYRYVGNRTAMMVDPSGLDDEKPNIINPVNIFTTANNVFSVESVVPVNVTSTLISVTGSSLSMINQYNQDNTQRIVGNLILDTASTVASVVANNAAPSVAGTAFLVPGVLFYSYNSTSEILNIKIEKNRNINDEISTIIWEASHRGRSEEFKCLYR